MKVVFLGTGVSVPCGNRAQSSILVEDGVKVLFDVGIGAFLRLEQYGVGLEEIDAVCLTHHHLDHNGDLLNILKGRWLLNAGELEIYGPPGTKAFMNAILEAYPYLRGKLRFSVREDEVFKIGSMKVRSIPTYHSIESRGYVIDDTLAISGDTRAFKEFMEVDCRVMIHELSLPFNYRADFHTTPENLKENLKYCKAEKLYLMHLYPMVHAVKDEVLKYLEYNVEVAEDLMEFKL